MDELAIECREKMQKCIVSLRETFATLRTGRASSGLLGKIQAEYYGDYMPINQICSISIPDARTIVVKPFDSGDIKSVFSAIAASDQNLNPTNNGDSIIISIPPLTEDKRKELVKKAKVFAEESKVAVRNIRRDYMDFIKNSDDYSEDMQKRVSADIEKVSSDTLKDVDNEFAAKEKDILSI